MKRRQLTSAEKQRQMNIKYSKVNIRSLLKKAEARTDLQGWRNYVIDSLSKLTVKHALDIGSGTGDKMLRLGRVSCHKPTCSIVDFADQPSDIKHYLSANGIKFYQRDIFDFVNDDSTEKYDLITMFGFVHEIKDHVKLAKELKNICDYRVTILISDNSLYKSVEDLHTAFSREFQNTVSYSSSSFLNFFHIFKKNAGLGPKFFLKMQWGRVDDILLIVTDNENVIKRISQSV